MKRHNYNRARELKDHREAKPDGRRLALDASFDMAICEYHNCDVVAKRRIGNHEYVLTMEFERTVRNILRNIRRNKRGGSDHQLIVCMGSLTVETVERLLERNLMSQDRSSITIIAHKDLNVDLLKALNGSDGVYSGYFRNNPAVNSLRKSVYSESEAVNSELFQGKCEGKIAKQIKVHGKEVNSTNEYEKHHDC